MNDIELLKMTKLFESIVNRVSDDVSKDLLTYMTYLHKEIDGLEKSMFTDMYISTIAEMLHKMGGEIVVHYNEGNRIRQEYDLDLIKFEDKDGKGAKLTLRVKENKT